MGISRNPNILPELRIFLYGKLNFHRLLQSRHNSMNRGIYQIFVLPLVFPYSIVNENTFHILLFYKVFQKNKKTNNTFLQVIFPSPEKVPRKMLPAVLFYVIAGSHDKNEDQRNGYNEK